MRFYICNGHGESVDDPSADEMRELLAGLDPEDDEHGAAWVGDDAGNTMHWSVGRTLSFTWADETSRHLNDVSIDRAVQLWQLLVAGRFDELEREAWLPGTHDPLSADELARINERNAALQLARDRELYDELGPERSGERCCRPGCARGTVAFSVLCKPHQFESIYRRLPPFDHA